MNVKTSVKQSLLILLSICSSIVPEISKAQSGWTEDECMKYAIDHNPRIRNKRLDTKIAHTDVVTAYGDFLPSINTTGALGRRFGRSIDPQTNQYTSESFLESTIGLTVSLPIFEGFSRINKLQFYKLNKRINVLSSKVEENNLAFEVLEAFYRYCFDKEMYKLAVEQRKLSECYSKQMIEYVDLGMRSLSDLQEVKARLQSDVYQESVKSNSCCLSLLSLKELMNMKDTDTLSVVMADEKIEVVACPLSLKELYFVSEATLPEFHIMEMQEKTSRKSLSIANGAFYPSIRMEFNLNTGYYDTEKNNYGNIVTLREQLNNNMNKYIGVCVSLPLFNRLFRMGAVRKEKLRLQQVQNENEQQRLSLYKEIHDTYLSFQAAFQECRLAKEQLRADSIIWKESEEKWKESMIPVFELLEKRNRYMRAKAEIIRTKLQYNLKKRMIRFYQEGTFL
jgi:Outer membrane protein